MAIKSPAPVISSKLVACRTVGGCPPHPHRSVRQHLHLKVPFSAGDCVCLLEAVSAVLCAFAARLVFSAWGRVGGWGKGGEVSVREGGKEGGRERGEGCTYNVESIGA